MPEPPRAARDADAELCGRLAARLSEVPRLVAVTLGGSAASGTTDEHSDIDLGLYYRGSDPPALDDLRSVAGEVDDERRAHAVTEFGAWGPWINGGAWLRVDGRRVDWLFRDLDRVTDVIADCEAGLTTSHYQPGHPHAFHSHMYRAEVREAGLLWDGSGTLEALQARTAEYPPALRRAIVERFLWEARFSLETADKAARRADVAYVAGCLYRAVSCLVQVVFALNEQSFLNEKGALPRTARLPIRPSGFTEDARDVLAGIGADPASLRSALERVAVVYLATADLVETRRVLSEP